MKLAGALIVLLLALTGCATRDDSTSAAPSPVEATTTPAAPITFSGTGQLDTAAAQMSGDYTATWSTSDNCVYYGSLESASSEQDVFNTDKIGSGTDHIYGPTGGSWHVHMITGPTPECAWTLTLVQD